MIEAMIEMGRTLLQNSSLTSEKIEKPNIKTPKGAIKHVVKIDFKIKDKRVALEIEEMDAHSAEKYLLLGREGGPNNPQWYLSFQKCNNIITQSIPNFLDRLEESELKEKLKESMGMYFQDFGVGIDKKYRYVFDMFKHLYLAGDIRTMLEEERQKDEKNAYKNLVARLSGEFSKYCEKRFELDKEQIGFYTLCIDGEAVVSQPDYLQAVEKSFENRMSGGADGSLKCSVCGSGENCTSDLRDMAIKYYTTNQCIFAHNMDQGGYDKNFVLCKDCYQSLLGAEKFIEKELKTRINEYEVYVVPHVIRGKTPESHTLRRMAKMIEPVFDISKNMKEAIEFRDKMVSEVENLNKQGYLFVLNLIFYKKLQQATKIQKLIKDVQPSVFRDIVNALFDTFNLFKKHFSEPTAEYLKKRRDLKMIYFMHAIKLKDRNPTQYQKLLWIYEALLYKRRLQKEIIFSNVAEVLQVVWRERDGYNVSGSKQEYFVFKVLEAMYYICFLQKYGCLEGGEGMDTSKLGVNEELKAYINEVGYNDQQAAMFFLGMLVGSIGKEQNNGEEGTYKPILNKINYMGMNEDRIVRLSKDVFAKLGQLKILGKYNNEAIYNAHCYLFGKEKREWKLNKNESLFYLLSGYAYQTMKKKKEE